MDRADGGGNYTAGSVTRRVPETLAGLRLDKALARMFPEHSRNRLQKWLREGHVSLDSRAAKPKQKIWGGERVDIRAQAGPAETAFRAERIALDIVHEDEAVLVIDKPAGLVVHPGSGNWQGTLLNALLHHSPQLAAIPRAGIVHRLDKGTSGLLVVAKTLRAQTDLVRQLQARTVKREYLAVVQGVVRSDGEIAAPVGRDPRNRVRMARTRSACTCSRSAIRCSATRPTAASGGENRKLCSFIARPCTLSGSNFHTRFPARAGASPRPFPKISRRSWTRSSEQSAAPRLDYSGLAGGRAGARAHHHARGRGELG